MATLLHTESRRKYSWWWDSHISPKNSKWLQENLTDMDTKVKSMIKLIEEDADSFARRAEMYYKKRPELMKLVEEFYRAYRALAERYDHATGALRQAHRTMAEAFPNQVPFILADDSPSVSSTTETEPRTPEMPHPIRAFCDPDDLHKEALGLSSSHFQAFKRNGAYSEESEDVTIQKGLKQLNDMFGSDEVVPHHPKFAEGRSEKGLNFHEEVEQESSLHDTVSQFSTENQNLKTIKTKVMSESERAGKAETEVQKLKAALAELEAEKETALFQYQQSLERLSNLETEVSCAEEDARGLNERASKAETEVQTLKQDLFKLQAEKEAGLLQYQQSMEKMSSLEAKIFCAEEDAIKLDERATKAEIEAQNLKEALTRIEAEKEAGLLQYKECLETISNLEVKLSCAEEDANKLNERAYKAETEVQTLKQMFAKLDAEKEAAALQYQQCLEKISNLEIEISHGQEEARRLNSEIVMGVAKLNSAEEQCLLLERANQSLQSEVEALVQKMGMQTQEITEKHEELERLEVCIQEEHLHFLQAEAALKTLQNLHSQSQEELRTLVLELQNAIQMWKDMELQNEGLMDEVQQVKEENKSLNEQNLSSAMSIKNQQEEIFGLRETKGKLEVEVELRLDQRNALQQEIYCLKEEINDLNRRHQGIMEQVELVGLNPKCLGSSVKDLQDENLKLKEICQKNKDERVALLEKLENMEKLLEKNALLENSLSDANAELDGFREKVKVLEESCQSLQEEKSTLVAEKASLVSQFEVMAENVEKLSEKNTLLENSLCDTNVELEGLKTKSNSLEESCQFIDNEKSALLAEKDTLVSQLESIQQRLEDLEKRYTDLEEKYSAMKKEKETTAYQVKELGVSLDLEKQARASFTQSSEARLAALEKQIYVLQEEGQWRKREYEEELDRAMNNQVEIFILKRFIQDMEEKNFSLLIECQKHSEVSKLSKKLISELEQENLKLQVETKSLFDQIKKLGTGINQVLRSLEIDPDLGCHDDIKEDQLLLKNIIGKIENTKFSFLKIQDEKLQLLFENSVLVTLLGQLRLEAANLESERNTLDKEFKIRMEELIMLQNEKHKLLEINGQLELEVTAGGHREEILKAEMEKLQAKLSDLQLAYLASQDENSNLLKENGSLRKELSDLTEKTCMLEEESSVILGEAMALGNLSVIFESFGTEKTGELKGLSEHLDCLLGVNSDLQNEARIMESKLGMVEMDNLQLKESVQNLENELSEVKNESNQLIHQVSTGKDLLCQKDMELSASEKRLIITESDNKALCNDIEELKREYNEAEAIRGELEKKIIKLSADNTCQAWEIGCLCEANDKFELEQGKLQDEIKELKSTEEKLSYELQEKINDIKLLEDEAATFYGDLQMSNVREALLKEKLHELIGACEGLEGESASKTVEIEQMNERFGVLEGENGRLKAELATYFPVIVSLRENITSLEDRALLQTKVLIDDNQEPRDAELAGHKDQPEGVSDLLELQTRVKAIERAVMEMEKLAASENLDTKVKLEAAMKEIQELKSRGRSFKEFQTSRDMDMQPEMVRELGDNLSDDLKLHKNEPEMSEVGNGLQMKDIPLDQVTTDCPSYEHGHGVGPYGMGKKGNGKTGDEILELWETAERDCSLDLKGNKGQKLASAPTEGGIEYHQIVAMGEQKGEYPSSGLQVDKELGVDKLEVSRTFSEPRQEGNKRKTLERLASDAQKLMNLQVTVEELKKKLVEVSGKRKNAKGIEYDSVKGQLQQVEEAIMQLVDINGALTKNTDESPLSSDGKTVVELEESKSVRRGVSQQVQQGSEKIGRLQLDLQKIQFILLKLDENESKGKTTVAEGRTRVLLRDYLYGIGKSHDRRKNTSFCGCVRPSTEED